MQGAFEARAYGLENETTGESSFLPSMQLEVDVAVDVACVVVVVPAVDAGASMSSPSSFLPSTWLDVDVASADMATGG